MRRLALFLALSLPVISLHAQHGDRPGEVQHPLPSSIVVPPSPIRSAQEELQTFKTVPGFRVELVAADPVVADPVTMQIGPDGRIWVVEMRGFMPDENGTNERAPVCDVAVLSDSAGDGRMDRRTVYADHLILPRALSLVDGGLLIGEPKTLWYMKDGKKTEVATDYGNIDNPEHNANGLMWAMDNWIYNANLTSRYRYLGGGQFRRDTTILRGQWGITQDDWGRIYYNSNSDPLRVDLIPSAYLRRNPDFAAAGANVQVVPALLPVHPGRVTPAINRGYKTLDAAGKEYSVTSACGPVIYRGGLFPRSFENQAFIAEPSGNLIKQIALRDEGAAIKGANAYANTEFLTSTDERFRPVNLFNGPDGALYVVDMYRGIIQHRIYLTTYLRGQSLARGLQKGLHYGRIWRIVPAGAPPAAERWRQWKRLAGASATDLVAALSDANGWTRDTAQRLLVQRPDPAATRPLGQLAADRAAPATARLQALWTLDGMGALDAATVRVALADPDAHVAAAAVRLAEGLLAKDAALFAQVAAMVGDRPDPAVRLQLALSLGGVKSAAGDEALRRLSAAAGNEPYLADAVVSGLSGREAAFAEGLVRDGNPAAAKVLTYVVSSALKSGKPAAIERVLAIAGDANAPQWARVAAVAGVRNFLPKSLEGKLFPGNLPAEPKALVALASARPVTPLGRDAAELLPKLRWPGKPGGESNLPPLSAANQKLFDQGKATYGMICVACHQPTGMGQTGVALPLVYSKWVLGDPRVLARIVLCGKAQDNLAMPAWKQVLNDEQIAGVLTYIRRTWGNEASPVPVRIVHEARDAVATRTDPWSDADLEDLQQDLGPYRERRAR